jgi:GntR family transcriptional regulator/MocR family aminotransferase
MQPSDMVHPAVYGLPALRAQIAAYLRVSRGISCSPSQIFVTSGYRHTIELIAHSLLKAGDRVWLEDPGYPPTREILGHMQIAAVPVPVDREGVVVSDGIRVAPRARAAVVTPAHQSPLCVSLSLPRRLALLDWLQTTDGSSRMITTASTARSVLCLRKSDRDGRALCPARSKVLFRAFGSRIFVPEAQTAVEQITSLCSSLFSQTIAQPHHGRVLAPYPADARRAARREATAAGLKALKQVRIYSQPGRMHLILRLQCRRSDRRLVAHMREEGLYAEALTDWTTGPDGGSALLLNFTNIDSQSTAEKFGRRILKLI